MYTNVTLNRMAPKSNVLLYLKDMLTCLTWIQTVVCDSEENGASAQYDDALCDFERIDEIVEALDKDVFSDICTKHNTLGLELYRAKGALDCVTSELDDLKAAVQTAIDNM